MNDLFNQVFPGMGLTTGASQRAALKTLTTGNAHLVMTGTTEAKATIERHRRALMADADTTALASHGYHGHRAGPC